MKHLISLLTEGLHILQLPTGLSPQDEFVSVKDEYSVILSPQHLPQTILPHSEGLTGSLKLQAGHSHLMMTHKEEHPFQKKFIYDSFNTHRGTGLLNKN